MSSLFINEHNGRYTVEPAHTDVPLHTAGTQEAAIQWAKANHPGAALHVARVRHLTNKRIPDHWRKI